MSTHIVLRRLRSFSKRYAGIIPAEKYSGTIRMKVKNLLPLSFFLERGYAAHVQTIMPISVKSAVTNALYNIDRVMDAFLKTEVYASSEKSLGQK